MADPYDAVMTQEEYNATYGGGGPTDLGTIGPANSTHDAVMTPEEYQANYGASDWAGIRNAGVKGFGALLGLADEVLPQISKEEGLSWPHLFGLTEKQKNPVSFQGDYEKLARDFGLLTDQKPVSNTGKFAANVIENAASAAPFGPLAMGAMGVMGGTGGFLGEKTGEMVGKPEAGKAIGSFLGGVSPAALGKLGILKEVGQFLGPTISELPYIRSVFGKPTMEAAVGRAIAKTAENLPAAEAELKIAAQAMGPETRLDSLKTTAEIAGDKGLARAEDAIQNAVPSAPFKSIAEERAAVRQAEVLKNYDPNTTAYDVSKSLEQKISDSADSVKAVEQATWKALPKDAPVNANLSGLPQDLAKSIDDITYSGALKIEGEAAGLLKQFAQATDGGTVSLGVIQDLRSKALEIGRATAQGTSAADRVGHKVAGAIEDHLRNIVDANVDAGLLSQNASNLWRGARAITKGKINTFGAPKIGTENLGTKAIEQIALKEMPLDNVSLLREGMNSPDKLASHLQAAAAGGQDIKPLYQQALKAELDGAPQSQWANIIDRKRTQWEMVFTPEEMANLDRNLADVQAQLIHGRNSVTSGSATNPRGNVQKAINAEKGLASLSATAQNATTLIGAIEGARHGWNKSETTSGGIANALLYGGAGAVFGKALKGATTRASESFDNLLIEALKDPRKALSAIEAAKPSQLGQALKGAAVDAAKAGGVKALSSGLNSVFRSSIPNGKSENKNPVFSKSESSVFTTKSKEKVSEPMAQIPKALMDAVKDQESGGKINAVSPAGAKGLYQLMDATGKEWHAKLGLPGKYDPFDAKQNETIAKAYLSWLSDQFGGDVKLALASFNHGIGNVKKLMSKYGATFDDIKNHLPDETQKYVPAILAKANLPSDILEA